MATASDLIKGSLKTIGAIAAGETPTASEISDALDVLNDILEEWSNDGFLIFNKKIESFPFVSGQGTYSIGDGADFDTKRPINILGAKLKLEQGYEIPLKVWNYQEWGRISARLTESELPRGIYYNSNNPEGEINVWPVPSSSSVSLILYSLKPLSAIASASDEVSFPPGYKKALKLALASELSVEFGRPISPKLEQMAIDAKSAIQRANVDELLMENDVFGLCETDCPYFGRSTF